MYELDIAKSYSYLDFTEELAMQWMNAGVHKVELSLSRPAIDFDEEENHREYFQFFLTDMSAGDADYLKNTFDLIIGYSPRLEKYVLFVDHFGTAWDYVPCEVKSASWWEINGEKYGYKHN